MTQKRHLRTRVSAATAAVAFAAAATVAVTTGLGTAAAAPAPTAPSSQPATGSTLAGKTVFLDPGHQGGSAGHNLSAQVPDGRGGKKDCQTTGATGVNGAAEHLSLIHI